MLGLLQMLEDVAARTAHVRTRVDGPNTTFVEARAEESLARLNAAGVLTAPGDEPDVERMRAYHDNSSLRVLQAVGCHTPSGLTTYFDPLLAWWRTAMSNNKGRGGRTPRMRGITNLDP